MAEHQGGVEFATLWPCSVKGHFGVNQCTCLKKLGIVTILKWFVTQEYTD